MPYRSRTHSRHGFTLVELLVVIAIVGILAAMVFPVFATARDRARQTMCASNLKQLGLAFQQYAVDYDSQFPTPGGRSQRIAAGEPSASPANGWLQSVGPGLGKDVGGIWPYVKQRGNGGMSNVYGCPKAVKSPPTVFSPGQNYAMNDYLRMQHPGQAAGGGLVVPGYFEGISQDIADNPSQLILLYEAVQRDDGSVARNGSVYFVNSGTSRSGTNLPPNVPDEWHAEGSNFLFLDGHVKRLKPTLTWTAATQASIPAAYANAAPRGRRGTGTVDMWNPQFGAVVYP